MKKKIAAILMAMTIAFTGIYTSAPVDYTAYADEAADKAAAEAAKAQLAEINGEKSALQSELNKNKSTKNSLNNEIKSLEGKIALSDLELRELSVSINLTQTKIDTALAQLDTLEADIASQNDDLNKRLRAMYMNGDVGFIDVLLGSSSISEAMTNMDRIQRIYDADQKMLKKLEEQHKVIDAQRQYLQGLASDLEADKAVEKEKQDALAADKATVAQKKAAVQDDIDALMEQIDRMNEEANKLTAEILKLQGNGEFVGGGFTWPAPGVSRITSPFGYRIHPIKKVKKLHTGMDIGCPSGTNIVASNAGTVIASKWNNSYGNMIMIDHGGGIVTLYAHNSQRLVNVGDVVAKGQVIAKSGNTGDSTGPHLHFEVRVNGNYVDPAKYVTYGQ